MRFIWLKGTRGCREADMMVLSGVLGLHFRRRSRHLHEFTLPCVRGSGLQYQRAEYAGGAVIFTIRQPRESYCCAVCGAGNVNVVPYGVRDFGRAHEEGRHVGFKALLDLYHGQRFARPERPVHYRRHFKGVELDAGAAFGERI